MDLLALSLIVCGRLRYLHMKRTKMKFIEIGKDCGINYFFECELIEIDQTPCRIPGRAE